VTLNLTLDLGPFAWTQEKTAYAVDGTSTP